MIRGEDEAEVQSVAAMLDELAAAVCARLLPEHGSFVKVALVDDDRADGSEASTVIVMRGQEFQDRYILLNREVRSFYRILLAHELVHWYADGAWDQLPFVLEEGLADWIACELDPAGAIQKRRLIESTGDVLDERTVRWALGLAWGEPATLPDEQKGIVYAVGYRIVEHLGVERLREIGKQARDQGHRTVPADAVIQACDSIL